MSYKHILLATDLSEEMDNMAQAALAFTKNTPAKLSIVHVMEHTPIVYGGGEFSIPIDLNLEDHLIASAKQAMTNIASTLNIQTQDQYVCHGSIKKEILQLAKKIGVDLIVVGSHGRSGMDFLLGSTANAILHSAKCDVLAIRVHAS